MTLSSGAPFGLYVHWPFCLSKCPYCDFNSHVTEIIDQTQWRTAYLRELDHYGLLTQGRTLTSVFFGGGTPSLMSPATVAALLDRAAHWWALDPQIEISLEANPGTVDSEAFTAFHKAGINRVSLGLQALDDDSLRFLGRRHTATEALCALEIAQTLFSRVSFDLIYARPHQTPESWATELDHALALAQGGHLSLYQLTIEQGTTFFLDHAQGTLIPPDENLALALWAITQDKTSAAGLPPYEVSNHARPGEESRHNLLYWQGNDYVGIGPGAHGRLHLDDITYATRQHRSPEGWLRDVRAQGHATRQKRRLSGRERAEEMVMMGLRLYQGIDTRHIYEMTGTEISSILNETALTFLRREGLVAPTPPLRVTPQGMVVLNTILENLLAPS